LQIVTDIKKISASLLEIWDSSTDSNFIGPDYDIDSITEFAATVWARENLQKLLSTLEALLTERRGEKGIKIVIYFDEAHILAEGKPDPETTEKSLHDILCLCLNRFLAFPIFTIFLSTTSSLVAFAAPNTLARSARLRDGTARIHPPITETPFDCHPGLLVKPGTLSRTKVSEISFMAQFGRPL
jgi:hypothetical protein